MLIPVKDDKTLFRDAHSKAILNADANEMRTNLERRKRAKLMASDVETLKSDMTQLKSMMEELLKRTMRINDKND